MSVRTTYYFSEKVLKDLSRMNLEISVDGTNFMFGLGVDYSSDCWGSLSDFFKTELFITLYVTCLSGGGGMRSALRNPFLNALSARLGSFPSLTLRLWEMLA